MYELSNIKYNNLANNPQFGLLPQSSKINPPYFIIVRFELFYFVPDGFFIRVVVDKAVPKSGVPSLFHLINCALGDLLPPHPSSGLSLA